MACPPRHCHWTSLNRPFPNARYTDTVRGLPTVADQPFPRRSWNNNLPASLRRVQQSSRDWLWFALQIVVLWQLDLVEDIVRGNFLLANPAVAIRNAHRLVSFEAALHLHLEPAAQAYFRDGRHYLIGTFPSWSHVATIANDIYGLLHVLVPLCVLVWVFARHRARFTLVRNVWLLANILAFACYFVFPVAPPRLTPGLMLNHHLFHFQDTVPQGVSLATLNGHPLGQNPYAAMPSLHMTWAFIVTGILLILAHRPLVRAFAFLYPVIILFSVVVTGNHWLMDAVGGALDVLVAALLAGVLARVPALFLGRRTEPQVA